MRFSPYPPELLLINDRPPSASWHTDYRDTAYIYVGGLAFDLSEGDIETIFSQYGVPTWIKLQRDRETGKSRGFAFLKYEDQRSCDLAVDNLGGATVLGRVLRVDHTRYKKRDGEDDDDEKYKIHFAQDKKQGRHDEDDVSDFDNKKWKPRPTTRAEKELEELIRGHDEEDPMKEYLVQEKRKEILAESEARNESKSAGRHRHQPHHRRHRDDGVAEKSNRRRHRDRSYERRDRGPSPDEFEPRRYRERSRSKSPDYSRKGHHHK